MVGLTGFTRLSKGLSAVLFIGYVVPLLFPWITNYVALVPVKTIPFAWNVITAGYIEQSFFGLILSIFGLLISGKLLEPLWTAREFMKFIIFVNTFTLVGVYVTAVTFYYVTMREAFLTMQLSGFYGVLSGFLVGVKQAMPDQEVKILWNFHMNAKWLPSLLVLMSIVLSFFTSEAMRYLPFVLFGTYGGWIYLRYLQKNLETNLSGDPHDEFAFSTFFPLIIRPVIEVLASGLHKLLCGKRSVPQKDYDVSDSFLEPGFETAESSRRRERAARALDERLQDARDSDPADESHAIV